MASLLSSHSTDSFLHEFFSAWVFSSFLCLFLTCQLRGDKKGRHTFVSCFFPFSWIWGISVFFYHLLELNWAVRPWLWASHLVLYVAINEPLDDRDGAFIAAFHTAISGTSKAREPQRWHTDKDFQSPSAAHIWHPDLSPHKQGIYLISFMESHGFPFTSSKGSFNTFIFC